MKTISASEGLKADQDGLWSAATLTHQNRVSHRTGFPRRRRLDHGLLLCAFEINTHSVIVPRGLGS